MLNVILIEDDTGVRTSLAEMIGSAAGCRCAGAFADAEGALEAISKRSLSADVVLVDLGLPRMDGVECVRQLSILHPGIPIIILTVHHDPERVFAALQSGAIGYLLKRTTFARLIEAIKEAGAGGAPMTREIASMVVRHFHNLSSGQRSHGAELSNLTHREREVLQLLARGLRYKEIAADLNISLDTVRDHVRKIYAKLHVTSRTEAVVKFLKR